MKDQNQLTPRKENIPINSNLDIEKIIDAAKTKVETKASKKSDPESPESIGISVEIVKCVDKPQGEDKIEIKLSSFEDDDFRMLKPDTVVPYREDNFFVTDALLRMGSTKIEYVNYISKTIQEQFNGRVYHYTHKNIGWDTCIHKKVFKLFRLEDNSGGVPSEYIGSLQIAKKGTVEEYISQVKKIVVGHPRLELAFALSVVGILLQDMKLVDANITINFCGETSSGKSQATKMPLSMYGTASDLFQTFNSTDNKMELQMAEYKVLPLILDDKVVNLQGETERRARSELVKLIFRYSTGHVKGRMNDGGTSFSKYYCPVILSTEESIIDMMKQSATGGQTYRFFEIPCKRGELTTSEKHSEELEQLMSDFGGVGGEAFVHWMLINGMYGEKLMDQFNIWKEKILHDFGDASYRHRMAQRTAVIMLSSDLLNQCFDLNMNLDGIQELLFTSIELAFSKTKSADKTLIKVRDYIDQYTSYFASSTANCKKDAHLGQFKINEFNKHVLWVNGDNLKFILSEENPADIIKYLDEEDKNINHEKKGKSVELLKPKEFHSLMSQWKSKGILISNYSSKSESRFTEKRVLFKGCKQENIYVIVFPNNEEE